MRFALSDRPSARSAPATKVDSRVLDDWKSYKRTGSLAARNRLVSHYMAALVRPVASRIHGALPQQVELDDLVQQGYLGLIDAMDRYQLDRDTRFETFARTRVFGAIHDYLRAIDPVPRLTRNRAKRVQAAIERFRLEHGRPPEMEELRRLLDVSPEDFERFRVEERPAMMVSFSSASPESDAGGELDTDAMDGFADRGEPDPVLNAARRDLQRWITRGFDQRDRLIIILYYYEQMTMREIGGVLGISESRVSQRLESILKCLRSKLHESGAEREFMFR
jgi:RNA polymerase sigma factor for flagellar operon FliA